VPTRSAPQALAQGVEEKVALQGSFDVDRHRPGAVVAHEVVERLGEGDVALIPDGDEAAGADARPAGEGDDLRTHLTALRDHRERAGPEAAPGQLERRVGVVHAEAVGADHPGPRSPHLGEKLRLARHLAGHAQEGPHAASQAGADHGVDGRRGHRQSDHLGDVDELVEVPGSLLSQNAAALAVDEGDGSSMSASQSTAGQPVTPLRRLR